ncbi:hypothetical protein [Paraflavitalea pollutisoli]|uniref:hypothetical protein n=1 Tax=Paraflavitalea pollutisoli TaxID=3034143 RepID=UPI0023EB28FF|nr:hypothetical protein [Paraflavitalea sp. H1-2-19X]
MRTVLFLICLCSLLLKGSQYVYTGIHHYSVGYYAAQQADKRNQVKQAGHSHDLAQYRDIDLVYEEGLVCEDAEDEEAGNAYSQLSRTALWVARGNPPPSHISGLHYLSSYANNLLPFCSRLPDIYLTQRVLRI